MITQKKLKELFNYNPDTGVFVRLISKGNAKAGDIAGYIDKAGYVIASFENKPKKLHRLAFLYMTGKMPTYVDHINHNKSDNRWNNLRPATTAINGQNRRIGKNNTSGVCGVSRSKKLNKWKVDICINSKKIFLGYHDSKQTAITIRKAAECWYGFHTNHGV